MNRHEQPEPTYAAPPPPPGPPEARAVPTAPDYWREQVAHRDVDPFLEWHDRDVMTVVADLIAVIDGLEARAVAAERLYLTVRLMRTFIGHEHVEPWPCPVFLVDEAQRALAALIDDGTERLPYPPDLDAIYRERMTAHVAALSGESGEPTL